VFGVEPRHDDVVVAERVGGRDDRVEVGFDGVDTDVGRGGLEAGVVERGSDSVAVRVFDSVGELHAVEVRFPDVGDNLRQRVSPRHARCTAG